MFRTLPLMISAWVRHFVRLTHGLVFDWALYIFYSRFRQVIGFVEFEILQGGPWQALQISNSTKPITYETGQKFEA